MLWQNIHSLFNDMESNDVDVLKRSSKKYVMYYKKMRSFFKYESSIYLNENDIKRAMRKMAYHIFVLPKIIIGFKVAAVFIGALTIGSITTLCFQPVEPANIVEVIERSSYYLPNLVTDAISTNNTFTIVDLQ